VLSIAIFSRWLTVSLLYIVFKASYRPILYFLRNKLVIRLEILASIIIFILISIKIALISYT
jgi:hypothetical protein